MLPLSSTATPLALAQCAQRLSAASGLPVTLLASIDSTNTALLDAASECPTHPLPPCALVALSQTAGRGRRGREWASSSTEGLVAPAFSASFSASFLASLALRTQQSLPDLGLLPLHIGVAVAHQLREWGCPAQLKWPNDIVVDTAQGSAKLGGILIETRSVGPDTAIVMGMGLNWHAAPHIAGRLVACAAPLAAQAPEAEAVVAGLLVAMHLGWQRAAAQAPCGFAAFDVLHGQTISYTQGHNNTQSGIAVGINAQGHLGVRTASGLVWLHSGEVSVQAQPASAP